MNKANLFVVGAPKCGTTSLYHYLKDNNEIFLPEVKEPHFFSQPKVKDTYYKAYFTADETEYLSYFDNAQNERYLGDFSPSYLFHQSSANRIKAFSPNAKVIAVLREPVDRAVSHYLFDVRIAYAGGSMKHYLKTPESNHYKEYVLNSRYYEQIKHYTSVFGDDFLVLSFNELNNDPQGTMDKIFEFLDIQPHDINFGEKHNIYSSPRIPFLYQFRKIGMYDFLKNNIPKKYFLNHNAKKPKMLKEREMLKPLFEDDEAKLFEFLGRELW